MKQYDLIIRIKEPITFAELQRNTLADSDPHQAQS
jgi:hypothetical protein